MTVKERLTNNLLRGRWSLKTKWLTVVLGCQCSWSNDLSGDAECLDRPDLMKNSRNDLSELRLLLFYK